MTVEAINDAIAGLPEDDRHSLAARLNDLDYDGWDRQVVKDFSAGGRGTAWAERVKRQIAESKEFNGNAIRGARQSSNVIFRSRTLPEFRHCYEPTTNGEVLIWGARRMIAS